MPPHVIFDEYDNGWMAVRGEEKFYVQTPSDEKLDFGSSGIQSNRRRVRLFAALCTQLGQLPILDDPNVVPVDVAVAGKSEIAAYLWAVHSEYYIPENQYYPEGIAERLGVSEKTITTYCRRVIRGAKQKKVGGIGW